MANTELRDRYFYWMCQLVSNRKYPKQRYSQLLKFLDSVNFVYTIDLDWNREADGINLRYRFGYENQYSDAVIANELDNRPCSVFEMMVALAFRCEEHIMHDEDLGDRTGVWFWEMVESLGLSDMTNDNFNRLKAQMIIDTFLTRNYKPDGEGGLFTIRNIKRDMRQIEIWYQLNWYLNRVR